MNNRFQHLYFQRASRFLLVVLILSASALLTSRLSYQSARADAGGNPTKTPTPSATPTITQTPPEYYYPTQIIITGLPPESIAGTSPPVSHQLPATITPLTEDNIYATLTATMQASQAAQPRSAGFWLYMLLLLGISAAVVGIIFWAMWKRNKSQESPPE